MNLLQLEYLVLLSDERNFTRAAQRANVAQPGFSRQIQKLEADLGVSLVDRTTRRVTLTEDGFVAVAHARRALGELDSLRNILADSVGLRRGRVTVGVTPTPGPFDLPLVLANFRDRHPGVELVVREDLSVRLADELRADELDLAFLSSVEASHRHGLDLERVATDQLRLVVHPHHRLAHRQGVRVTELRDESFILFPRPSTIRESVVAACHDAGFDPPGRLETGDPWQAMRMVHAGLGVAFLPSVDLEQRGRGNVAAVEIVDPSMPYDVFVARRTARQPSPAASLLWQYTLDG